MSDQHILSEGVARAADGASPFVVFLVGDDETPCGIGDFAQGVARAYSIEAAGAGRNLVLGRTRGTAREIWAALDGAGAIVISLPLVGWKRVLFKPLLALLLARLRGVRTIVMLHEWAGVHGLRRLVLRPLLWLANEIVVFSPFVRDEVLRDPLVAPFVGEMTLMPVPPNIERPARIVTSPLATYMKDQAAEGRLVLASFGSLYPGKTPDALLDIVAELKRRGMRPLMVFIGSFIKSAGDSVEDSFNLRIQELELEGDVLVSGHVASHEELFGLFDATQMFLYCFGEGLTSRRGSVLVCAQADRPVIVNAPPTMTDFQHHHRYRDLLESGAIVAVPREDGVDGYVEAILRVSQTPPPPANIDVKAWWGDIISTLKSLF